MYIMNVDLNQRGLLQFLRRSPSFAAAVHMKPLLTFVQKYYRVGLTDCRMHFYLLKNYFFLQNNIEG
jgi:hypothetical protein